MKRLIFPFILWLCSLPAHAETDPKLAAQQVFDLITELRIDGLPNETQLARLSEGLSVDLIKALAETRAWQQGEIVRMQREEIDEKPPLVEGDLFSSLFEGAQSALVLSSSGGPDRVTVTLQRHYGSGKDRVEWVDRAIMIQVDGHYLLDDIEYGGEWAFQAGGASLRATLTARD